jgi:hypothetical protein
MTWGRQLHFPSEGRHAEDFYRPWPGLNPQTLGLMASTVTARPQRMAACPTAHVI